MSVMSIWSQVHHLFNHRGVLETVGAAARWSSMSTPHQPLLKRCTRLLHENDAKQEDEWIQQNPAHCPTCSITFVCEVYVLNQCRKLHLMMVKCSYMLYYLYDYKI